MEPQDHKRGQRGYMNLIKNSKKFRVAAEVVKPWAGGPWKEAMLERKEVLPIGDSLILHCSGKITAIRIYEKKSKYMKKYEVEHVEDSENKMRLYYEGKVSGADGEPVSHKKLLLVAHSATLYSM